jgi:cytochrome-b5 reductase
VPDTEACIRPVAAAASAAFACSQKGHFELVIKKYPDGKVSSYMHSLKPGDSIKVKGPIKKVSSASYTMTQLSLSACLQL